MTGRGQHKGKPVVLDVQVGAEGEQGPNAVYAIDARIEAGADQDAASGGISQPDQLQGIEVRFELTSPDATELLRALGIEAPALPPIQTAGKVIRNDQVWQLNDASAQVGDSNLAGRLSVDLSRPVLSSALTSIGPAARAGPEGDLPSRRSLPARMQVRRPQTRAPRAQTEGSAPLLTAAGIDFDALPKVDVDAKFRGSNLEAPEVQLAQLEFDLKLRDRRRGDRRDRRGHVSRAPAGGFEVHAGTEDSLKNPESRYPLDVTLSAGESHASAKGTVDHPLNFTGVDVDVALQGPDLGKLGELLQLPLPGTPPYKLAGKVTHQEQEKRWNFVALRGTVGDSDIQGDVSLELSAERPTVLADLRSKTLDLDDLGVLVGRRPAPDPAKLPRESRSRRRHRRRRQRRRSCQTSSSMFPSCRRSMPHLLHGRHRSGDEAAARAYGGRRSRSKTAT